MHSRTAIDAESKSTEHGGPQLFEFKSAPGRDLGRFEVIRHLGRFWPATVQRSILTMSFVTVLLLGVFVPGFLGTMGLLLVATGTALAAFLICVQLPIGYLAGVWRRYRRRAANIREGETAHGHRPSRKALPE